MILETKINKHSEEFLKNYSSMKQKLEELQKLQISTKAGGNPESHQRQKERNKYPVRERIERIKDRDTQFLEFSTLAGYRLYQEDVPAGGIITGIAVIHKRPCVIVANDPTVKGGTYFPITIKKHLRAQEIALENHLPCIYLVDSGGAYLPYQDEVFPDREHFGRIFYNQARLSAKGITQISAVLGHCTAGGAYVPAMSDENIIVKDNGTIFLAGPPLVEAATGEKVDAQELGGATLHTSTSGVSDHFADNEEEALQRIRDIVFHLGVHKKQHLNLRDSKEPMYPADEIYGILPSDLKQPFDVKEIIARLVDGSEFHEFKKNYGTSLVTGWAHLHGYPVGILANQGVLFSESALKATHFIDLCDKRKIPLLFLQNIVGFMVGREYESEGITKHGAKMVTAVSLARVPKFTVIIGASYGAGNYGMCGRAYQPRQLWMWPSARIAVMGGSQAEQVLQSIKVKSGQQKNDNKNREDSLVDQYKKQSTALYSTARLWDDGIIDPTETRKVLAMGLDASLYASFKKQAKGIYRM